MHSLEQQHRSESSISHVFAFVTAILICVVLNPLNSSTISVALPTLLHALHTTSYGITWIISGYYLGSAVAQPVMGKLGDLWGRSRFVYGGLVIMIVTAILAPLSQSLLLFVLWRIVQAIGTSMIYPNAIGLLRQYQSSDVGKILGWIGMAGGIAVAIGPTIGGLLVDLASWHSIFWLNIPLALSAIGLFIWVLPRGVRGQNAAQGDHANPRLDWFGMIFFTAAITAWLFWSNSHHPFVTPEILVLVVSAVLTIGLIIIELRQSAPIVPVQWFRRPQFTLSALVTILINLVMYCILYGLPIFLETERKLSATTSGLVLLTFAGVMSLSSPLGGRAAQGNRRRLPLLAAGLLLFCGTLILSWITILPLWFILFSLVLIGVSFAISNVVVQQIVLESVSVQDTGQASGVYTLLRYLGTILSSVLIGSSITTPSGTKLLFILLTISSLLTVLFSMRIRDRTVKG